MFPKMYGLIKILTHTCPVNLEKTMKYCTIFNKQTNIYFYMYIGVYMEICFQKNLKLSVIFFSNFITKINDDNYNIIKYFI